LCVCVCYVFCRRRHNDVTAASALLVSNCRHVRRRFPAVAPPPSASTSGSAVTHTRSLRIAELSRRKSSVTGSDVNGDGRAERRRRRQRSRPGVGRLRREGVLRARQNHSTEKLVHYRRDVAISFALCSRRNDPRDAFRCTPHFFSLSLITRNSTAATIPFYK